MFRFHWLAVCTVMLGVIAVAMPAQSAPIYTFENLAAGGNLIGQDNWVHANTLATSSPEFKVLLGSGSDTSKVATALVPQNAQVARQNDANFSIPTFTSTAKIYLEADFEVGNGLAAFGLIQAPGGNSFSATSPWMAVTSTTSGTPAITTHLFNFRPSFVPGGGAQIQVQMATAAPEIQTNDWIRLRMELDLTGQSGNGSAGIFYKDLTLGQTSFTPIAGMQGMNAGILANSAANKYLWDSLFLRASITDGTNSIDNLEVGIISAGVPEPASIGLLMMALVGVGAQRRRKN
jgi:PEP-CTERM motif-containing protein